MNRRQALKSCVGAALSYPFVSNNSLPASWHLLYAETSEHFSMTVNGVPVTVHYAAGLYSYAHVDITTPAEMMITALQPAFWKNGVDILPSRHGLRPTIAGDSIRLTMEHAEKIAVSRPGDYYVNAPLLFLFGYRPSEVQPPGKQENVRIYRRGIYHEDIHVQSEETVYLEEGAVVYGSLNFWNVKNAHVYGSGTIIHDGAQNPQADEGWQHRANWHGITGHNSDNISIKGITVIVRSRTWMIQLQGCKHVLFENIKVIGGTSANANQDGIDWLGCGDTVVRNCFFRCSDDIFAIYGNTGFYDDTVSIPGTDVENILIEDCVLSTSISNIMRVGWPRKVFNSRNVVMRNCDVIHAGQGGCVVPFALAEFWSDPDGRGLHSNYLFENIRMDSIYSLAQLLPSGNGSGSVKDIRFKNIRSATPALVSSAISGLCDGISFENIKFGDHTVERFSSMGVSEKSSAIVVPAGPLQAAFTYEAGILKVGQPITFTASPSADSKSTHSYSWNFGDGSSGKGAVVSHLYENVSGTRNDGSGRYQVQLTVTDTQGRDDVMVKPVIVGTAVQTASKIDKKQMGLNCSRYAGLGASWENLNQITPTEKKVISDFEKITSFNTPFTLLFDGYVEVPFSGGYTFYMMARDGAFLQLNNLVLVNSNMSAPQVCNTPGSVVQQYTNAVIMEAGFHSISFGYKHKTGSDAFALYWQAPGIELQQIPMGKFFISSRQ